MHNKHGLLVSTCPVTGAANLSLWAAMFPQQAAVDGLHACVVQLDMIGHIMAACTELLFTFLRDAVHAGPCVWR
jgi:hypothetical protein